MIDTGIDINIFECEGNLPSDVEFKNNGKVAFFSVCTSRLNGIKSTSDRHYFVVKGSLLKSEVLSKLKKDTRVHAKGVLTYFYKENTPYPSAEIQCTSIELK